MKQSQARFLDLISMFMPHSTAEHHPPSAIIFILSLDVIFFTAAAIKAQIQFAIKRLTLQTSSSGGHRLMNISGGTLVRRSTTTSPPGRLHSNHWMLYILHINKYIQRIHLFSIWQHIRMYRIMYRTPAIIGKIRVRRGLFSSSIHYPTYYAATCQKEKYLHTVCLIAIFVC